MLITCLLCALCDLCDLCVTAVEPTARAVRLGQRGVGSGGWICDRSVLGSINAEIAEAPRVKRPGAGSGIAEKSGQWRFAQRLPDTAVAWRRRASLWFGCGQQSRCEKTACLLDCSSAVDRARRSTGIDCVLPDTSMPSYWTVLSRCCAAARPASASTPEDSNISKYIADRSTIRGRDV